MTKLTNEIINAVSVFMQNSTDEEYRDFISHVSGIQKFKREGRISAAKQNLFVGGKVFFKDRSGTRIEGFVRKIMRKNVRVETGKGFEARIWTVTATLLTAM
jgi:hypothetical protein